MESLLDPDKSGARPCILLADDNLDTLGFLRRLLISQYEVMAVTDGEAAWSAIQLHRPSLLITDIMMPELDGLNLLTRIRADKATQSIPVIIVSARAGEESQVQGLEAGADDYLIKPFSGRELLARVRATLHMARLRQDWIRQEERFIAEQQTAQRLREDNRRKDELLAMLAHELRNPLAAISSGVEVSRLKGGQSPELQIIDHQVQHLTRLVSDLLDISRVTLGKVALRLERLDTRSVLEKAIDAVQPLMDDHQHRLILEFSDELLYIRSDATRLEQIVVNLLTNAAKYTEPGGHITLGHRRDGDDLLIYVRDNGTGIPPELLPHIFDLFRQGERSLCRAEGGLGIGLTLAKTLVEMHGGSIEAKSEGIGKGSEFVMRFPGVNKADYPPFPVAIDAKKPLASSKKRILLVDDNRDAVFLLTHILEFIGHEVIPAYDGLQALELGRAYRPNVALLDIGLPGLSGYQLAEALKRDASLEDLLIIAISGYGQEEDMKRSQQAGFHFHFVKPVNHEVMLDIISQPITADHMFTAFGNN